MVMGFLMWLFGILVVDGNKTKQASGGQHGIAFKNSSNVTVENVTVKNYRNQG